MKNVLLVKKSVLMTNKVLSQRGIGLMEVLISMIIISIGLLGVLGLNASLKLTIDAIYRQQALTLAQDLANRMKFNFVDAHLGSASQYNDPTGAHGTTSTCNFPNSTGSINCSSIQMAQFDLYQIYQTMNNGFTTPSATLLPSGTIKVCLDSSTNGSCNNNTTNGVAVFSIIVSWKAPNGTTENVIAKVAP